MHGSIIVALTALGITAMAGAAIACPAHQTSNSGEQQTVMTGPATTQTPAPGKPGG
jgi:hypothetical protein